MQGLYSEIRTLMYRNTVHTTPTPIKQHVLGPIGPLAIESASSSMTASFFTGEQHLAHQELLNWQSHLDTDIEQEIKQGNLTEAWNSVNNAMSRLEIIDSKFETSELYKSTLMFIVHYDLNFSEAEELQSLATSLWLRLVEWECILSFFVCGRSRLSSWLEGRFLAPIIRQRKLRDILFATRIDLHYEIQGLLQIDMAHEEGLCELLQYIVHLQRLSEDMPSAKLKQIATKKPGIDSVEEQELHLIANLTLVMLHCRTATTCAYYNEDRRKNLSQRLSDLLKREELEPSKLRAHLITPASRVLDSFMNLCMLDSEGTINSWSKVHSVLIAAVVVMVTDLKTQRPCKESVKRQVRQIRDCFMSAKPGSNCNAILEKGTLMLDGYLRASSCSRKWAVRKGKATQSRKRHNCGSPSSKRCTVSQARNSTVPEMRIARLAKLLDDSDSMKDRGSPTYNKGLDSALISSQVQETQVVFQQQGDIDSSWSNNTSFTTTYECLPVEHSDFAQYPFAPNVDLGSSLASEDSTAVAQSIVSSYYHSNGVADSLSYATPSSPYTLYPEYPPRQVWRVPYRDWPGEYQSYDEKCAMVVATDEGTTAWGEHARQSQYLEQMVQVNYTCQMPAPRFDLLGQCSTNPTEGLEQAAGSFGSDPTIISGSATHCGMDQASTFDLEVLPLHASHIYQQGFGECHAVASIHGQGRGFGEE